MMAPFPTPSLWSLAGTTVALSVAPLVGAASPQMLEVTVISYQPELYHGWPTLARRRDGELLLVYSGGREEHICPFGRVELMRSRDNGKTWSWPQVLLDTAIDDRDAGVLETAAGTLLVTTFTSLAYAGLLERVERALTAPRTEWQTEWMRQHGLASLEAWPAQRVERWRAAHRRVSDAGRQALLGQYMLRSTDGGLTWSAPY
ncbi:MAG: sialidase family protein, partial [Armatimonadota bacterium]|nr:sialidase family protein [Armatimonadota bacterium]